MLYLPKHTYHRWHQFMSQTLVWKGATATPGERTILTNMENDCVPTTCAMGKLAYCVVVSKGYMKWRAGVSCKTLCQMWDSWYFPTFLFRDGSLTQMNMASLLVLVILYVSMTTMEKQSLLIDRMSCRLTVLVNGGGHSKVFPKPVPVVPSMVSMFW